MQVNHLHPDNALHLRQFDVRHWDDAPRESIEAERALSNAARRQAIGDVPPFVESAFGLLSGSMIHDIYGMRIMLGLPDRVVSTEIWRNGRAISFVLEYPEGFRCVASWVDLSNLWHFQESLEVYADAKRVLLSYPSGFTRSVLSRVVVEGVDDRGTSYTHEPQIDWDNAFLLELRHFYDCIANGAPNRASIASARDDVNLIINIIERYLA